MRHVRIDRDFESWRSAARALLGSGVEPARVSPAREREYPASPHLDSPTCVTRRHDRMLPPSPNVI
jgi:hypothetical protein